jgi:hypothetical protein
LKRLPRALRHDPGKPGRTAKHKRIIAALALFLASIAPCPAAHAGETSVGVPFPLSETTGDGDTYMGIRLLGALDLTGIVYKGLKLTEISGLAWDDDEALLYALSDQGRIFHLRPEFHDGLLSGVQIVAAYPLRDAGGRVLRGRRADAEGLEVENARNGRHGDSRLIISFERIPRIQHYEPNGRLAGTVELTETLRDISKFSGTNKALETVTVHPSLGILTGPEWPLRGGAPDRLQIFAMNGDVWDIPRADNEAAALVSLEAMPDGSLIVLQRSVRMSILRIVIGLYRITAFGTARAGTTLPLETLAQFDSAAGWRVDNFEGLARHRGAHFFMVSDDNERPIQRTILVYLQVLR